MIRTQLMQVASSALILVFGLLAWGVWRRSGPVRRDRAVLAWAVTAASFLIVGAYATTQSLLSSLGAVIGTESRLWTFLSGWGLAFNAGRCVASVVFGVLLTVLMVAHRRSGPRIVQAAPAVLVAAAAVGTAAGRLLPDTTPYGFLTVMAILNAVTAVVMMAALLAAVQNDGMDQLLWLSLAAYALKEAVCVSVLAVMAWWSPYVGTYYSILYWIQVVLMGTMVALAARRLQLATGGRRVPAVFERLHALRRPAHG